MTSTNERSLTLHRQKSRLESILNRLDGLDKRYVFARGISLLAGAAVLLVIFFSKNDWLAVWILFFFIAIFATIVIFHRRLDRSRLRFRSALSLVSMQLARLELDWKNIPASIPIPLDPEHPFAADLDIVGDRSPTSPSSARARRPAH